MSKYAAVNGQFSDERVGVHGNERRTTQITERTNGGVRVICDCGESSAARIIHALILADEADKNASGGFDWQAFNKLRKQKSGLYD